MQFKYLNWFKGSTILETELLFQGTAKVRSLFTMLIANIKINLFNKMKIYSIQSPTLKIN